MSERDIARAAGLASERELALLTELLAEEGLLDHSPPEIVPRDPEVRPVLSHAQLRLWFVEQLAAGEPIYNIPAVVTLPAGLDVEVLERAVHELERRHELLRLRVPTIDGVPAPELAPLEPFVVERVDLRELDERAQAERCELLLADEAARPFDLARGPLLRMRLVYLSGPEWVLSLTMHHLIADAWSVAILVRELGCLCEAFAAGLESPLAPPRIQYFDFAAWQRRVQTPESLAGELDWWAAQLDGLTPFELPGDRPAPVRPTFRGGRVARVLAAELSEDLRELSVARGVTSFVALHAGLVATLARLGAGWDIGIGTVTAGRDHPEVQDLIGFLANTVVLRVVVDDDPSVAELLARCRTVVLDAQAHAEAPFALVVQRLGLDRAGHQALFRIAFLHTHDRLGVEGSGGAFGRRRSHAGRARFDLTIYAIDDGDRIRVEAEYSHDRFEAATIEGVLEQYATVLAAMVERVELPISTLPLASAEERAFVRRSARGPAIADAPTAVIERFAARVNEAPETAAVLVFSDDPEQPPTSTSYAVLGAWVARLCAELAARGVGPGAAVAVLLPRDASLLAACLAVSALGATWVPLTQAIPPARREAIVLDARVTLILTGEDISIPSGVAAFDPRPMLERAQLNAPLLLAPPPTWSGLQAYVLHTSGSTGRPKGVAVGAGALAELLEVVGSELGLGPGDRVLATAAVTFDIAFVELVAPVCAGATVVLGPEAVRGDPRWLRAVFEAAGVTFMQSTPSTWAALVAVGWQGSPGLRMLAGGEALSASLARALLERGATLWNGYGPTEATVYATFERVDPARGVGIGRPLPGRRALVLDERLEPAPVGAPGQLYLAGGLAEGYVGQPRETAARFIPAPDPEHPGERLYATGDRARLRADGRLEFLGRSDQQVKVRGFRIELPEIEGALARLAGVRRAAVRVVEDHLEAFVEAQADAILDPAGLHEQLAALLPDYMLPARYREVATLPTTTSGKLDRGALDRLALDRAAELHRDRPQPPRGPTERQLAAIWAELLELDTVDRHDNFYLCGGHSLLAVRLAVRIEASFAVRVPLRAILEAPTVAGLAARLDAVREEQGQATAPVEPGVAGDRAPLSPAQASIWRFCAAVPRTAFFNVTSVFVVPVELPEAMLARALAILVERHATLRTRYEQHGASVEQRVEAAGPVALRVVDLRGSPEHERAGRAAREQALARLEPLDLGAGELLRAVLVILDSERSLVALTVHHIAADGWSLAILTDELAAVCEAEAAGRVAELPALRFSYADYAVWQQARREDLFRTQLDWWRRELTDLRPFTLPPDHAGEPGPLSFDAAQLSHSLGPVARARVASLAEAADTTPYVVLLATTKLLLGRRAGTGDVRVSTLVANRDLPGSEQVVGCFLNSLVLRSRLDLDAALIDAVERVRTTLGEALARQDLPLDLLLDELELVIPRPELARIQIVPRPRPTKAPRQRQAEQLGAPPPMLTTFDLFIDIDAAPDAMSIDLRYRADRYEAQTIVEFAAAIEAVLVEGGGATGASPC